MLPAIKVWKMDYSFIIKNYLNPALWQKTWTLFEYKDFVITIKLTKIETENMRIVFRLNLRENSRPYTWGDQEDVSYSLKGSQYPFSDDTDIIGIPSILRSLIMFLFVLSSIPVICFNIDLDIALSLPLRSIIRI